MQVSLVGINNYLEQNQQTHALHTICLCDPWFREFLIMQVWSSNGTLAVPVPVTSITLHKYYFKVASHLYEDFLILLRTLIVFN